MFYLPFRCVVSRMCVSRTTTWSANISWWQWRWPISWNNQGPGDTNARANQRNEQKLYGIQIPTNQSSSMAKGGLIINHLSFPILYQTHFLFVFFRFAFLLMVFRFAVWLFYSTLLFILILFQVSVLLLGFALKFCFRVLFLSLTFRFRNWLLLLNWVFNFAFQF